MTNVCRRCGSTFTGQGIFCGPCAHPGKFTVPKMNSPAVASQGSPPSASKVEVVSDSPQPSRTASNVKKKSISYPQAVTITTKPAEPKLFPTESDAENTKIHLFRFVVRPSDDSTCDSCKMKRNGVKLPILGKSYTCLTCPAGPNCTLCEWCYWEYLHGSGVVHPRVGDDLTPNEKHQFKEEVDPVEWTQMRSWVKAKKLLLPSQDLQIPDRWILRPEFFGKNGHSTYGSHSFTMEWNNKNLLITALHTLSNFGLANDPPIDPSIDNPSYHYKQFPEAFEPRVNLYDVFQKNWIIDKVGEAGKMVAFN